MKKKIVALLAVFSAIFAFGGCSLGLGGVSNNDNSSYEESNSESGSGSESSSDSESGSESTSDSESGSENDTHTYTAFTADESKLFTDTFGFVIPFVANDEYKVEEYVYYYEDLGQSEKGLNFYAYGLTDAEFNAYLGAFTTANGYVSDGTSVDSDGDTWYSFVKDGHFIDLSYYTLEEDGEKVDVLDVYVFDMYSGDLTGGSADDTHTYTAFTAEESKLFTDTFGFVVPFAANDEYYVEEYVYYHEDLNQSEKGLNFYAYDLTNAEFNAYLGAFTTGNGYVSDGTSVDSYGDTCYYFIKNEHYVDVAYYVTDSGSYVLDVYVYDLYDGDLSGNNGGNGGNDGPIGGDVEEIKLYNEFTATEKALFSEYFGFVIPFLPNNSYKVDEYNYYNESQKHTEVGLSYCVEGLTEEEFNEYIALFTVADGYTNDGSGSYNGDILCYFSKMGYYIDITFYTYKGVSTMDLYVYEVRKDISTDLTPGIITNEGKGLPKGENGVYTADFTDAVYAKNVTEQGYYLDGCPTTGSPKVLVIPVEFSDITAESKGFTINTLKAAFEKDGKNDYVSVYDYYLASSYGQLTLDITVASEWFRPKNNSTYYANAKIEYFGEQVWGGDQIIMDEALAYFSKTMDLSEFDSDKNGVIDAVVMINTLDVSSTDEYHWAYRYWNSYSNSNGEYYEYDGVYANDYVWASYQFLHEKNGRYTNVSGINTYTFIHEFAHVLGSDDYYDTSYTHDYGPMEGYDVMDRKVGDHNPYTKFHYGWLTSSRVVVAESSVTLTLEAFAKNGDTIILANNWDPTLGAYQEYYILCYYTKAGLNAGSAGAFTKEGVVVYHINASLYKDVVGETIYYDVYNNNTDGSDEYGTEDNLIEFMKSATGNIVYAAGDRSPSNVKDDQGNTIAYTFRVDSIADGVATITFTKNK